MRFDEHYEERVSLSAALQVRIRLVRPDDKRLLLAGFDELSPASRQKRFFGGKHGLSDEELRYLTELDQLDHFALGAVTVDADGVEGHGVGIARFVRLPDDAQCAEVALTVVDRMQGIGIGRRLLERLVDAAVERGIERFRFECLPHNHEMTRLVERTCKLVALVNDDGAMVAEVELPGRHASSHDALDRLFALLRAFAIQAAGQQLNVGLDTMRRSFDLAREHQRIWIARPMRRLTDRSTDSDRR